MFFANLESDGRFLFLSNVLLIAESKEGEEAVKVGWMGGAQHSDMSQAWAGAAGVYATPSDFCRVFKEDTAGLYLLSLLLTADPEQAERCFVAGLEDCINGNPVFRAWGYAWSRRAIVMNAIRTVFSLGSQTAITSTVFPDEKWKSLADSSLSAALKLESVERFVFVMSLLEGYSDHECSVLLNRSRAEVASARASALQHLAERDSNLAVRK